MATLKEVAQAYEPKQTKNIADLPEVAVDVEIKQETATDNDGKDFTYSYLELNEVRYRVPGVVIGDLKAILKENSLLKRFKVKKAGTGLQTRYTVIPLS